MKNLFNLLVIGLLTSQLACKVKEDFQNSDLSTLDAETYANEVAIESLSTKPVDSGDAVAVDVSEIENDVVVGSDNDEIRRRNIIGLCREAISKSECRSEGGASFVVVNLEACRLRNSRVLAQGEVQFSFNNSTCSIESDGGEITRTFKIQISKLFGAKAELSSERRANYLGQYLSGGDVLTKTKDGFDLQVLGSHKEVYSRFGRKLADISISTSGRISTLIDVATQTRQINGGRLEINHNLAKFSASYSPENLTWNESCLCPVSGRLLMSFSGSKQGDGYIEFLGCGEANVKRAGSEVHSVQMARCIPAE